MQALREASICDAWATERRTEHGLVGRSPWREMAPVKDQMRREEGLARDWRPHQPGRELVDVARWRQPCHGEVGGEGAILRFEIISEALVQGSHEVGEPAIGVREPGPDDAGTPRARKH